MVQINDGSNKTPDNTPEVEIVKAEIDGREVEIEVNSDGEKTVITDLSDMTDEERNELLVKASQDKRVNELANTLAKVKKERLDQNRLKSELERKAEELARKEAELLAKQEQLKSQSPQVQFNLTDEYNKALAESLGVSVNELSDTIDELSDGDASDKIKLETARATAQGKVTQKMLETYTSVNAEKIKQELIKEQLGEEYSKIVAFQKQYGISSFDKAKQLYSQMHKTDIGNGVDKIASLSDKAPIHYKPTTTTKPKVTPQQEKVNRLQDLAKFYG